MKSFSNIGNTTRYVLATFLAAAAFTMAAMPNRAFAQTVTGVVTSNLASPVTPVSDMSIHRRLSEQEIRVYITGNKITYDVPGAGTCALSVKNDLSFNVSCTNNRDYGQILFESSKVDIGESVFCLDFKILRQKNCLGMYADGNNTHFVGKAKMKVDKHEKL